MNQQAEQQAQIENDLWSRLRESTNRLAQDGRTTSDPAALAEKLAARAKQLRGRMTAAEPAEAPLVFLAFSKGNQRYGIPVDDVIEIQALDQFSPVPATPHCIPGVVHWRGDVLALLDLGNLLEIPEPGLADLHVCLIVEAAGRRVGLVAFEIEEIHSATKGQVKATPELPGNILPEWIIGIYDDNRIILNLDNILQDTRLVEWRKE